MTTVAFTLGIISLATITLQLVGYLRHQRATPPRKGGF